MAGRSSTQKMRPVGYGAARSALSMGCLPLPLGTCHSAKFRRCGICHPHAQTNLFTSNGTSARPGAAHTECEGQLHHPPSRAV